MGRRSERYFESFFENDSRGYKTFARRIDKIIARLRIRSFGTATSSTLGVEQQRSFRDSSRKRVQTRYGLPQECCGLPQNY
jgi:hypothetical protein